MAKKKGDDVVESLKKGLSSVSSVFKDQRTPEARLLERRDRKRRNFRTHRMAYATVVFGIALMNMLMVLLVTGSPFGVAALLWLFPALGWGMGFAIHGLSYRSWMQEHGRDIALAERKLGRIGAGASLKQIAPPKDVPVIDGVAIIDEEWRSILDRAKVAIARAGDALGEAPHRDAGSEELRRQLTEGLSNIERLAAGAERITDALDEIAPDGGAHLEIEIDAIDAKINDAGDDQLKEVYLANRTMLVARQKKLEALSGERARMKANAQGFLIAAENVRLDIAGLTSGVSPAQARKAVALAEPVRRLTEEVEILRKVEAELKQFS